MLPMPEASRVTSSAALLSLPSICSTLVDRPLTAAAFASTSVTSSTHRSSSHNVPAVPLRLIVTLMPCTVR